MKIKKSTKIVATIGPATESVETLTQLVKAGMNVARFNTKHSDPEWHNERMKRVKKVSQDLNAPIGILVDLQGPEVRIDLPAEKSFPVKRGEIITFSSNLEKKAKKIVYIPEGVISCMSKGNLILLDDGSCEFIITKISKDTMLVKAVSDCEVKHRKTMNTPGAILGMPSITKRDLNYLDKLDSKLIDYIGLSFVRDAIDIQNLKKEMAKRNIKAAIISKIENQAALDNLDEIINESDAVMIARGDLGVEVDYQQLVYWQKKIIFKCRKAAKPVITATQMLKSMVDNPRPTRAEVSDIANAVYDGTDAVMLSEETTIGNYPVESVKTQAEIVSYNEQKCAHEIEWPENNNNCLDITSTVASLLFHTSQKIDRIVCLTESGYTAKLISRFRPKQLIYTITSTPKTYRQLSLVYGCKPYLVEIPKGKITIDNKFIKSLEKKEIVKKGELVLFIHGPIWKKSGETNTLSLVNI